MKNARLTVLSVAGPLMPVGPEAVSRAAQRLALLDAMLVRAGHRSIVVAAEGAVTAGTLVPTPAPDTEIVLDDAVEAWGQAQHRGKIVWALEHWPVDVIHLHGSDFPAYLPPPGVPALVTLHLPPACYPESVFQADMRPHTYLHCLTETQERACPQGTRNLLPYIEDGRPERYLTVYEALAGAGRAARRRTHYHRRCDGGSGSGSAAAAVRSPEEASPPSSLSLWLADDALFRPVPGG